MTKQRKAQLLTGLIMAGALAFVMLRATNRPVTDLIPVAAQPKADPTPQDAIYAMLDAAREGNVQAYLAAYTGQMETSLKQSIAEQGEQAFGRYLKETNQPVKGIAITEPQTLTESQVKVRVEYVFQDRNEIQFYYLEKQGKEWKIARLDAAERIKTLVPYGTPVQ
ncbi:MAG: DUF4878 domain-containing protein [Acidimicrobiia bacterium]|nr:DUF4878 domain-containing protein [Acidimicrobiia bacterium]